MKNKILKLIGVAAFMLATLTVNAQTIGGGTSVTGTTNAPLWGVNGNSGASTNSLYLVLPAKTVFLSGIGNTNETVVFSYGAQIAGTTNVTILASITNYFLTGTNGGSFSINVQAQNIAIPIVPFAQVFIGSNLVAFPFTNTIYVP
jgi:hypothetical protein